MNKEIDLKKHRIPPPDRPSSRKFYEEMQKRYIAAKSETEFEALFKKMTPQRTEGVTHEIQTVGTPGSVRDRIWCVGDRGRDVAGSNRRGIDEGSSQSGRFSVSTSSIQQLYGDGRSEGLVGRLVEGAKGENLCCHKGPPLNAGGRLQTMHACRDAFPHDYIIKKTEQSLREPEA